MAIGAAMVGAPSLKPRPGSLLKGMHFRRMLTVSLALGLPAGRLGAMPSDSGPHPYPLVEGLGSHHRTVSACPPLAQR